MGVPPSLTTVKADCKRYFRGDVMKRRAVLVSILSTFLVLIMLAPALAFTDVGPGTPYSAAIADLSSRGVVSGFADGTFRPSENVKRMQFAKMIVKALDLAVSDQDECPFPDVPGGIDAGDPLYARHYVAACAANNITKGKTAATFAPYDSITREQLITMVARAAALPTPPAGYEPGFAAGDFSIAEHFENARKADSAGLLSGLQGTRSSYDFMAPATRGECAQMLSDLIAYLDAAPFSLAIIPQSLKGDSIAGQRCVFLVTVAFDQGQEPGPVALSATAIEGAVVTVTPQTMIPGEVAEVSVTPGPANVGATLELVVKGTWGETTVEKKVSFAVAEGEDDRAPYAAEMRDRFVAWLAAEHPELGITLDTEWQGTMVSPVWLIVSHYLFFSEEWEMHVSWHVMIAPYDWAKIDLRKRFTETAPSHAFEISSVSADDEPHQIDPPEEVWR